MKKYLGFTQDEKYEIIRMVSRSDLSANRILKEIALHKRTYYNWYVRKPSITQNFQAGN